MVSARERALQRIAERMGFTVNRVGAGTVLVRRPTSQREVIRLGDGHLGTHLVVNRKRARRDMNMFQKRMGEILLREQVAWVLRATEADVVVDVGANVGQYARSLRRAGFGGRIVSLEPVRAPYQRLAREAAGDPEWQVLNVALGAEDGRATINVAGGTMSSMLQPSAFGRRWTAALRGLQPQAVELRRLDGLLPELTAGITRPRVFLKMDTQGYDLQVFAGAAGVLGQVVGLQTEAACVPVYDGMPRLTEHLAVLEEAGFENVGMYPVARHLATLRVIEYDVVMVRPEQVRRPRA